MIIASGATINIINNLMVLKPISLFRSEQVYFVRILNTWKMCGKSTVRIRQFGVLTITLPIIN